MSERRTLQGVLKLLSTEVKRRFAVELWLLNDKVNENGWRYERIAENKDGFLEMPILTAYVNGGKTIGDGHNFQVGVDENGDPAPSFTGATDERIVGVMSSKPSEIRAVEQDGKLWIVGKGYIFSWYARELVEKIGRFSEQGRSIPISIETLVTQSRMEEGVEVEEEYEILGVTILGDMVAPAVKGAKIYALNWSEADLRTAKMRAASLLLRENQNQNESEGKTLEIFTAKQNEALQAKFGDEYKVLKAVKDESGVVHVALCRKDYAICRYEMGGENETVVPANVTVCSAMADLGIGENVDLSMLFEEPVKEIARLNKALEDANKAITQKDNQISAMREAENKRRVKAAKDKAEATLAGFNANRESKVDESAIKALCDEIEGGKYTEMTDKDGEWCGDRAVEDACLAICAREVQKEDAAAAKRNNSTYIYDKFQRDNGSEGGVMDLFRRKGVKFDD